MEASRAQIEAKRTVSPRARLLRGLTFGVLFTDMRRFRLASRGLRFYQRSPLPALVRKTGVLERFDLADAHELMPRVSEQFVVPRGQTVRADGTRRGRVALFTGCIMSTAYADVHRATVRVLTRNGFDVTLVGEQGCCGALHVHGGDPNGGRALARRNIEAFDNPYIDAVIVNAAGCGAQLKEYAHLLRDDPAFAERAAAFSGRVKDVTEFLTERGLTAQPGPLPMTVTYQEPCHLAHAQRITRQPRELLEAIPELRLVEMPESSLCCGSAGIYNLIQPDMASKLLERKLNNALGTEAEAIVSANPGCMLQLTSGLRARGETVPVLHLVEILDRAYSASAVSNPRATAAD